MRWQDNTDIAGFDKESLFERRVTKGAELEFQGAKGRSYQTSTETLQRGNFQRKSPQGVCCVENMCYHNDTLRILLHLC